MADEAIPSPLRDRFEAADRKIAALEAKCETRVRELEMKMASDKAAIEARVSRALRHCGIDFGKFGG